MNRVFNTFTSSGFNEWSSGVKTCATAVNETENILRVKKKKKKDG